MNMNVPALLRPLRDIVDEHDAKLAAIEQTIADFEAAVTALKMGATVAGTYVGTVVQATTPYPDALKALLRKSAWRHVYDGLNIDQIASATDKKRFELSFTDPPPFTLDNIRATFGEYIQNPRFHILKGLAECFSDLDPAFKSHQKVKIGVEKLPKRIILRSVVSEWGSPSGWGFDRLRDTVRAVQAYDKQAYDDCYRRVADACALARKNGAADVYDGLELRVFGNGNGHLIFHPDRLLSVNRALAEFYGDVLPDAPGDDSPNMERDLFRSREVSKDLAYYPTPPKIADLVMDSYHARDAVRALEPSCGDGRLLDAMRRWANQHNRSVRAMGIEVQEQLAQQARDKGYSVLTANFLQVAPPKTPDEGFELVLMNPPFAGQHWKKHLVHARKFLKSDGHGICILPAAAYVDGHLEEMGFIDSKRWARDRWTDLPTASFHDSGTNVATGFLKFYAK